MRCMSCISGQKIIPTCCLDPGSVAGTKTWLHIHSWVVRLKQLWNRGTSGNKGGQSLMVYMMNIGVVEPTHNIHQPVILQSRSEYVQTAHFGWDLSEKSAIGSKHHLFRKVASSSTYSHEGIIQMIDTWPSLLVCPSLSNPFQLCGSTPETTIKPRRWIDGFEQSLPNTR